MPCGASSSLMGCRPTRGTLPEERTKGRGKMRFTHQPTIDGKATGPAVEYADPDEALTTTGLEATELSRRHRLIFIPEDQRPEGGEDIKLWYVINTAADDVADDTAD